MSISSSLNAGVAGLNANATRLATISDNIANSATYGYKRARASFHSMVMSGNNSASYSAGGVRTTTMRLIDERGQLISTNNATDIAVAGRGFLPVTTSVAANNNNGTLPLMLMTTGSFRPDAEGVLRNETGMVLLGWPAGTDGTVGPFPRDTVGGLRPIQINMNQFAGDPTSRISIAVNLPSTSTIADAAGTPNDLSVEYFSNLGTAQTLNIRFTPNVPASGASNQWTMTVTDPTDANVVVGEYTVTFDDGPTTGGRILSVTQTAGAPGGPFDPASGEIALQTASGQALAFFIGRPGEQGGISQLSNSFAPVSITKDGSPVGMLLGLQIDANGFLRAIYDQGYTRVVAQVPLVDVPNPNGLISNDNQAYRVSPDSGGFFLWDAGDGPTGQIVGFAREESATDVAAELTQMIQTQRAYSSNAKVIQTVDEMLQETTNIKR